MVVRQHSTNQKKRLRWSYILAGGAASLLLAGMGLWIAYPTLTYKGVPVRILVSFLEDAEARRAYFAGEKTALHARLKELGVEEQVKDFYRPQFQDEQALDLYIHQLLYENTGYVGAAYVVDAQGQLKLTPTLTADFWRWFNLAKQLQLAIDQEMDNGEPYIITPQGSRIPYTTISALYPVADLEKWAAAMQPLP
ncbi:hypothetical protein [Altericista sp. CCNU0014]|uniref:hypothetical protein n=1 Tax=Altericista sp. CCNU0014 TaxID=3082949 RepID=UPI003850C29E